MEGAVRKSSNETMDYVVRKIRRPVAKKDEPVAKKDEPVLSLLLSVEADTIHLSIRVEMSNTIVVGMLESVGKRLGENFIKCVRGYHIINDEPIKESPWEDINAIILNASGCRVNSQSSGSHRPGGDLSCSLGEFSNKSTQYDAGNKSFKISSYRLTTVCSDKMPGTIEEILGEIHRRKNFNFYSMIVREETDTDILYDWYLLPSDYPTLDPASYIWHPKYGKIGKNKGAVTGWQTDPLDGSMMSITFSMSSQLWIHLAVTEDMKKYKMGSCRVNRGRQYNYIQLYERESPSPSL